MAKQIFTAAVVAASASIACSSAAEMYTVTGACDVHSGGVDGQKFLKRGSTARGAPWYKAIDSETYLFWDPDCMGSSDGTPRWIIDHDKPDLTKMSDLDNDHFCDYVGRIDSNDPAEPPVQGLWTLNCGGSWQQHYVILLEGTTTEGPLNPETTTTKARPTVTRVSSGVNMLSSMKLEGACDLKGFLNDLVYDEVGETADGRPFFKAQGRSEYMYYDKDCDGPGGPNAVGRWVLDNNRPSTTALQDLDEDDRCDYHARLDGSSLRPPTSATWRMYCGAAAGGWANVELEFSAAALATTTRHGQVNSAHRSALPAVAAALVACAWALGL